MQIVYYTVIDYTLLQRLGVTFDAHEWESEHHITAKKLFQRLQASGDLIER